MTDIELLRQVFLQFQSPLRYRIPMPWPEFNREARRYAEQKSARQLNRLWVRSGKDFQKFTRGEA